ncbi:EAL domain-containing protein [Bradyrhizobium genosp. L]|uniref:EAL domain-containing protein n=1 Tax=Bradyrhizobium genosp. L TaxID=83637 RepID=UPI001FEE73AC|nr:EAL domain-containing protein [Bradyrhizobium genosp. L]
MFGLAGHLAATRFIHGQQTEHLGELTEVVLRRAEFAVDDAAASLDDLVGRGLTSCDTGSLQSVRLHIYQRSAVKDVRVANADGSVICSAYSETLEFDKGWVSRGDMLPAQDPKLSLFRVEQFGSNALGLLRDIDRSRAMVAILAINGSIVDIMPAELRASSKVALALTNTQELDSFALDADRPLRSPQQFDRTSTRYPLRATIDVESAALSSWNAGAYWPALMVSILLGLAFGGLLVRSRRTEGPLADLDRGLARGEFKPYFQPIFDLASGRIVGCEVLARWLRDDGSVVPPMKFIPLAESSGRIETLTWQLLELALSDLQAVLRADKEFKLSFNVVPKHLLRTGFVDRLRHTVSAAKVSARQIVIEVTERDELDDFAHAAAVVGELRSYGFRVAIDDVGVGHSGLSRMKGLGANIIKIDKFFVDTITIDASTAPIVEMLVALAEGLQMTVVAEGIESDEQIRALTACGVKQGQGYVVAAPLPVAKFLGLIETERLRSTDVESAPALVA